MKVFVLNWKGKPLMPCSPTKAAKLTKASKAKWVDKSIPTIQLKCWSTGYKQPVTLGVDAGSKHVGISATTEKEELVSGEAELRDDVVDLLSTRKALRKSRRGRKTRHRKARFDNRRKEDGWLAPSIRQKVGSHVRLVKRICRILPVTRIIVEVAQFDMQRIKNPEIKGSEYQHGEREGWKNVREYVLWRDEHRCQNCKGKSKDPILEVHHIESRKTGGNAPNNLVTLCRTCHERYHRGEIKLRSTIRRGKPLRDAAFMNIMRWRIVDELKKEFPNVWLTFGYITKDRRIRIELPKEHRNDAYCIAGNLEARNERTHYMFRFVPRHTRVLHAQVPTKGGKRRPKRGSYYIGKSKFTKYDKVKFNGQLCFISGSSNGRPYLKTVRWEKAEGCKTTVSTNRIRLICHKRGSMVVGIEQA